MDHSRKPTTPYLVMGLFEYMHAPAVCFYYLGACTFSLCVLQKTRAIPQSRRWSILALMVMILAAYVMEVLYYFSRATGERHYEAPKPAAIRCLGSILVWSPLTYLIWSGKSLPWHAFFGAIVLQLAFETTTCLMAAFSIPAEYRQKNAPAVIEGVRAIVSLLLLLNAFVILVTKQAKVCTDEERQALLGYQANHSENGTYRTTTEEAAPNNYGKDVKAQQAQRLEEEGGWFGYLKGFAVFLPYLFPRDDWKVMGCLFLRLIYMLEKRVFNLLRPRQLGIITTKLQKSYETQSGVMPWKDIGLLVLYSWINSYAGLGAIDGIADIVISNSASRRITLLAYRHVLTLSMDFHTSKDSGEVLKAFEQASSLNTLIRMVFFDMLPILLDLVVAMYYVTQLFDAYMAFIVLVMGAAYITIGWYFTTVSQPKRRDYVEKQRAQNSTVNETVHNWQTVAYFNRLVFEHNSYAENIMNTISAQYSYYFQSIGGHAAQDLLKRFGFAGTCIFGMSQIVTGREPVGNLVTLIMYWNTMTSPLYVLSYSYRHISNSLIDAERLLQLLNTKPTVDDQERAKYMVVQNGEVEFKDVHFHYDERKPIIKSLLSRFYDVTSGFITIDGQDLRFVTQASLRDALGVVPQDPVLFNWTIRQNIRYAKLDATDIEIEDACRDAAIHDDIVGFPDSYNCTVGEGGVKLSGGQSQRIAIARVFLKNPKIVMLDEATSAIDSSIEALIQQAFRKLSQGRTTFVIAHRLSTIADADQILVVRKGEIIESGTHAELLEMGGKYRELWDKQTRGHVSKTSGEDKGREEDEGEPLIDITPDGEH